MITKNRTVKAAGYIKAKAPHLFEDALGIHHELATLDFNDCVRASTFEFVKRLNGRFRAGFKAAELLDICRLMIV